MPENSLLPEDVIQGAMKLRACNREEAECYLLSEPTLEEIENLLEEDRGRALKNDEESARIYLISSKRYIAALAQFGYPKVTQRS